MRDPRFGRGRTTICRRCLGPRCFKRWRGIYSGHVLPSRYHFWMVSLVYTCRHRCVDEFLDTREYLCMNVYAPMSLYRNVRVHVSLFLSLPFPPYIYIYICTYIYIYMNMYVLIPDWFLQEALSSGLADANGHARSSFLFGLPCAAPSL